MNKFIITIFINALLTLCAFAQANAFVISTSKELITEVSPQVLRGILTGKKAYWNSGDRVKLCHISTSSINFQKFLKESLNMSSNQYLNLWRRKLFTGRGFPPTQVKSEQDVIDCVKENESAIGIVSQEVSDQQIYQSEVSI